MNHHEIGANGPIAASQNQRLTVKSSQLNNAVKSTQQVSLNRSATRDKREETRGRGQERKKGKEQL